MNSTFRLFEQDLTRLHARVGDALAQSLNSDTPRSEAGRVAAFALLLGDFYYLLQWLWTGRLAFDNSQGQWIAALEEWMERMRGDEPSELSVPGRVRLWTAMLKAPDHAAHLSEILEPAPRSVLLLQDFDALNATQHAQDVVQHMAQFAHWAVQQNVEDWSAAALRLESIRECLPGLSALGLSASSQTGVAASSAQGTAPAGRGGQVRGTRNVTVTDSATTADLKAGLSLDSLLAQLDALVGLPGVKAEVKSLVNLLQLNRLRADRNLPQLEVTRHLVFHGAPGTGKTTVARLLAGIFKALGLLQKGHLVETDRSGLVAAYVGQTALKVKRVANQADGGVLFIDEAYALARGENDFGGEAIETLLKLMEDRRDSLVVIVAGYTDRMQAFIQSNPGLKSRFTRYFNFEDYDAAQLCDILQRMVLSQGMHLTDAALQYARARMQDEAHRSAIEAGNARFVRNCFEKATIAQANRLSASGQLDALQNTALMTLETSDIEWALNESLRELC